jgi:hypothetical protein
MYDIGEARSGASQTTRGVAQGLCDLAGEVPRRDGVPFDVAGDLAGYVHLTGAGADRDMVVGDWLRHALGV